MKVKTLSPGAARKKYDDWMNGDYSLTDLPGDYQLLRSKLCTFYKKARTEAAAKPGDSTRRLNYLTDALFGLKLYMYLKDQTWFSLRNAADPAFWRFMNVAVVPDILKERWGNSPDHFYAKPQRLYLSVLWWYVHFAWGGDEKSTYALLVSPNMNTDVIQGIVERPGRLGTYVEVMRKILFYYGCLKPEVIRSRQNGRQQDVFRSVMTLNTARLKTTDPDFYRHGPKSYAYDLFLELGFTKYDFTQKKRSSA
ncbi:hypothetical protein [Faecalibaculum rodentium]|uniref:hypothetical protein n=2 Tax=Faecalibaculum rodentium TaxID=1702221 RepID=UPI002572CC88|nr:hypothetical protein [Faecalibaculum rodentium]